jgi:uncharacterized membrane protein YccC
MALQMGAGLGAAFAVAHRLWPDHWSWTVLTAYIVASGNRGRGDVIHKSGLRVVGAAAGTVIATLLASTFPAGDRWAVVAIFVVLALASWLRSLSYAYWAGCVTAALAFLYGYFGESGTSLLRTRLEGILCGAAIAIIASWLIFPVKTQDVVRRRIADALAVLTDYLTAARRRDLTQIIGQQSRFDHAVAQLEQLAAPVAAHHRIIRHKNRDGHPAAAITALRACRPAVHVLTGSLTARPRLLTEPGVSNDLATIHATVIAARRAMARTPAPSRSSDAKSPSPAVRLNREPRPTLPLPAITELTRGLARVAMDAAGHWSEGGVPQGQGRSREDQDCQGVLKALEVALAQVGAGRAVEAEHEADGGRDT